MDHQAASIHKERIYYKSIKSSKEKSLISIDDSILVICAGHRDKKILEVNGFKNVTISNLDDRLAENEFAPYKYSYQNAEDLAFDDEAFDWVLVHAGLHHCYRPHRAFLEMLRVGKKGAIVFEARDSFIIRTAKKWNLVPTYEVESVIDNDLKYGGVANTQIPNYIYRWKEREIESMVDAYFPIYKDNKVHYFHNLRLPTQRISFISSRLKRTLMLAAMVPVKIFCTLFPSQSNEFGFMVVKGNKIQDWLREENGEILIDTEHLKKDFKIDHKL